MNKLVTSNNQFALKLYNLIQGKNNLCFSPDNILVANAMLTAAAGGKTAEAIAKACCFDLRGPELHNTLGAHLLRVSNLSGKGATLASSNDLWLQQGYRVKQSFIDTLRKYGACTPLDFRNETEEARRTINEKVKRHTKDKIVELFEPGVLKPSIRSTVTSAIYFEGQWQHPFSERETYPCEFHLRTGETVEVPMMHQKDVTVRFLDHPTIQMVELPYGDSELSMLLLGFKHSSNLSDLGSVLSVTALNTLVSQMTLQEIDVNLPRFEIESDFKLKGPLSELGMAAAFDEADWSGITEEEQLKLDEIVHKAVIKTDERGTVSAAATGATFECLCISTTFDGSWPFIYFIRDKEGMIYFMGKVENPLEK